MRHAFFILFPLLLFSGMGGCYLHPVDPSPAPPVTIPDGFSDSSPAPLPEQWWKDFNDPALDSLIQNVFAHNLQFKAMWATLQQIEALSIQSASGRWPQLSAEASALRQEQFNGVMLSESDVTSRSLKASYELDVFGKLTAQSKAGYQDYLATRDSFEALAISLAAETADTYLSILTHRALIDRIQAQIETNQTFLELVELRYNEGLTTAVDVYQLRRQVAALKGHLATTQGNRQLLRHKLALLQGKSPTTNPFPSGADIRNLPPLPNLPGVGLPANLLERRPDVRAAQRQVIAADHRVVVALANLFPTLKLSGSVGYSSIKITDWATEMVWSVIGSITQPLFAGRRLAAEVDRTKAVVEQKAYQFGQTLLQALMEVENALVQEKHQKQYLQELQLQFENASAALREARSRYLEGLENFLTVLTALQSVQEVEKALILGQYQLRVYRVQLCRALGGTWTQSLESPTKQPQIQEVVQ